jgi:hypothetical protein
LRYTLENGKTINISDKEVENSMKLLELTKEEAIQLWLEDNDYLVNEELEELDAKAKKVKIDHGAQATKPRKKSEKPRTVKVSDAKKEFFSQLSQFLTDFSAENDANCTILKENKLFQVEFGGEIFKLDLIQQRKPKK